MKEKIERLSKGDMEFELPNINLPEDLKITVETGKIHEGTFVINNSLGSSMKGIVHSSSRFMLIESPTFDGSTNVIKYQFNAVYRKAGEIIHGEFIIVSDCGEATLPFTVQTEASSCITSLGKVKDLFQFTNTARMDWSDAKKIFRSPDFEQIFLANEERYRFVYRNLLKSISTSQAMEEFLIVIHKKAVIRLDIDKTQVEYTMTQDSISDKLTLTKSHWGFAEIRVSTDAPFIQLEQKFLWADRFIGNNHQISYSIHSNSLKQGNNYGHIWIKTAHQTITVNILCKYKKEGRKTTQNKRRNDQDVNLTENYLNFRLNHIDVAGYLEAAGEAMDKMPGPEVSYAKDLVRTHLAIISGKSKLAEELLADFAKEEQLLKKKSIFQYCAYLYLEALYHKEDTAIKNAADTIRGFYLNGHFDWRILWFLLYIDKRYEKNLGVKLEDIREQFASGCRSPIIYYEAVCIFNEEPFLLRELTDFEIQVLNFGIKNDIISKETARQFTYLAGKEKNFNQIVFNGLVNLYEKYGTTEILTAICCILIKGLKKSEKYFEWYRLGVNAQLRITELYEYYMYSIRDTVQEVLPQPVLLYFIYNSSLNDRKKAYLYANVIKYREKQEQIYRSYYKRMEIFAYKMLENHSINRDLAVLYREFLNAATLSVDMAQHLPYVMYRYELICENPNMVGAIILHKEMGTEETIPLMDGRAQFDIYSSNVEIFLTDSFGNRYLESVEYSLKPLMHAEEYEDRCIENSNHPMLLLHLFDRYQNYRIVSEKAIALRKKVLMIDGLSKEYITFCQQSLIEFYYENYDDELLEFYLNQIDLHLVRVSERIKFIEFMVIRAFYKKALEALETFGFETIPLNRLLKLCSGWLHTPAAEKKQDFMLNLCYYVYSHGKYDEAILSYLLKYYHGATTLLFELWKAAKGFVLDSHILEERLLSQILFTQDHLTESFEVFKEYYKAVTNSIIVRAYLSFCGYQYLVHDTEIDPELFIIMKRELFYEENDVCLLAWLKSNADNNSLSENERIFAEYNLQRLVKRGIELPFFLQYHKKITLPDKLLDKCFVTYFADPGRRIYIHYRISNQEEQEFITERMPNVIMGIHVKEFVLFYHEEVQYFITVDEEEGAPDTAELQILNAATEFEDDESNYNRINRMLMAFEKQQDDILLDMMENYAKSEYMISTCFKQID